MAKKVAGLDTMRGVVGQMPSAVGLGHNFVKLTQNVMSEWNHKHIAIVLYCLKCKTPLDWYTYPQPDELVLFKCPKCGTEWIKEGDRWTKNSI